MAVGKIQKFPRGLLQYLGMVGTGVPPTLMADDVRATVDMAPFYDAPIDGESISGNLTNVADSLSITVPQGQQWLLLAGVLNIVAQAVGESFRLSVVLLPRPTLAARIHTTPTIAALDPAAACGDGFIFDRRFLVPPGTEFLGILDDTSVALARAANLSLLFHRIEV